MLSVSGRTFLAACLKPNTISRFESFLDLKRWQAIRAFRLINQKMKLINLRIKLKLNKFNLISFADD